MSNQGVKETDELEPLDVNPDETMYVFFHTEGGKRFVTVEN